MSNLPKTLLVYSRVKRCARTDEKIYRFSMILVHAGPKPVGAAKVLPLLTVGESRQ